MRVVILLLGDVKYAIPKRKKILCHNKKSQSLNPEERREYAHTHAGLCYRHTNLQIYLAETKLIINILN